MAYLFYRQITCGKARNTDQSNFPLLIKFDSSNVGTTFKSTANGGHLHNNLVNQSGGNNVIIPTDLIFTSDAGGTTKIPWEIDYWDVSNGVLWVWVKVATLTTATNATIYCFYDDITVNTQQNTGSFSPSNVWDSNFKGVWHFPDGTTLYLKDSTSNANNGTGAFSPSASSGQVDGSVTFGGSSYIDTGAGGSLNITGFPFSFSCWINLASTSSTQFLTDNTFANSIGYSLSFQFSHWHFVTYTSVSAFDLLVSVASPSASTWYHIAFVQNASNKFIYINGSQDTSNATPKSMGSSSLNTYLGAANNGGSSVSALSNGSIMDEARISNTNRSSDWIGTEYDNQSAPLTFNSIGAETAAGIITSFLQPTETPTIDRIGLIAI